LKPIEKLIEYIIAMRIYTILVSYRARLRAKIVNHEIIM